MVMSEPPTPTQFSAAIPFTLATIMHGNHMACVWHAKGLGLFWGTLYNQHIDNMLKMKQCFLLQHKAINNVICFGEMLSNLDLT
jgi:hypothetical protein